MAAECFPLESPARELSAPKSSSDLNSNALRDTKRNCTSCVSRIHFPLSNKRVDKALCSWETSWTLLKMYLHNLSVPAGLNAFLHASIHPQATGLMLEAHIWMHATVSGNNNAYIHINKLLKHTFHTFSALFNLSFTNVQLQNCPTDFVFLMLIS